MHTRCRFGLMSLSLIAALLSPGFFAMHPVQADARVNVNIGVFHNALSPYGNWVNHPTYGQVWYPRHVARDWRPYTDGYWAYTDDYGWLWVANEPWGWAPFHYGRWAWDNWYGWVWVPGQTWAPAWVFWRSGGGYAAWAPMPPNVVWQPGIGLNISYFNYDRDLHSDAWVAVHDYDIPRRHIREHIIPSNQNLQIINVTNYNQNVTLINNTIVNQGVPVRQIEQITHQQVMPVVPNVHESLDITQINHNQTQPSIIRLPMAEPTPNDIRRSEELAKQLNEIKINAINSTLPTADFEQAHPQGPREPGRLVGVPTEATHSTPEMQKPAMLIPGGETLPPSTLETTPQTVPVEAARQQELQNQQIIEYQRQQDERKVAEQMQQQEVVRQQELQNQQNQQIIEYQRQQDERKAAEQMQQQEVVRQQELQNQQNQQIIEYQRQQDERKVAEQMQSQEAARQQEMQNQQNQQNQQIIEYQRQQDERKVAEQMQQQEVVRQQELQNQQNQQIIEYQRQQDERKAAEQMQQQDAARQQEMQNQQSIEYQRQQDERKVAEQMQQQEVVRQQEMQNQQIIENQRQQAERIKNINEQKLQSME